MRLLEGNQSLEEVSIKRDREEKKLEKLKSEKLRAVQSQFAMVGTLFGAREREMCVCVCVCVVEDGV